MLKKIAIGISILFFIIGLLIFRPVPIVAEDRALVVEGSVVAIRAGGTHDIVIKLKDDLTRYYINRGEELGLNILELQTTLMGQPVVLKYPKYWTPLDWNDRVKHISKLEQNGRVLFNELK